ncbi:MAG: FdhF/YdeP family oxidoreductase [Halioglobus sp.]|nr:FdhF/YdeP family oxidoreductase [Halioglobus sp.]
MSKIVGGGPKKVLYTLNAVRRIGLKNSAKALTAKNTCKACGLGMGGQLGGMTNELGEFPSVCNKSVQAQSTDIQPPIPSEIFTHSISELRELSAKELEHSGRLGTPIFKASGSEHYEEVDWDWALQHAITRFQESKPDRSFFYASGRSSNEAGFLLQLLARLYGTNNVTNCSFYCHQATSVGLGSTIGTGTATIELEDLAHCDTIFIIGANPSSNHPRLIHQLKNCRDRGGQVIVINPAKEPGLVKFSVPKSPSSMIAGGTDIASLYLQPNIGGDIGLLKGLSKAVLALGAEDVSFINTHTDGFSVFKKDIDETTWQDIEKSSGISKTQIYELAEIYSQSNNTVFAWGMGITHHQFGSANVEYIANLALLRGMLGKRHAGLLPLRGHSNVQGVGTIGVKPVLSTDVFQKIESTLDIKLPTREGLNTLASLEAAYAGEIDNACIVGGNLYSATPDSKWAEAALDNIFFKLYLTTTLNQGHLYGINDEALVLPVCARDEEKQSTTQESMFNFVRLSDGGPSRIDDARSEVSILSALGKGLIDKNLPADKPFSFEAFGSHEKIRDAIAKTVPGMEDLKDIGVAKEEFYVRNRLLHTPHFNTLDNRASFRVAPMPQLKDGADAYPFLLASVRSEGQFNSIIYEEKDSYRYNADRNTVLISPSDMIELGIADGHRITVTSASGKLDSMKAQAFDIPPGNVLAYYPEANVLCEKRIDPRSFTPSFKSVRVRIELNVC